MRGRPIKDGRRCRRVELLAVLLALCPGLMAFDPIRSPSAAVTAGNGQMQAGKPSDALASYDKAVKELPGDPGAHFDRGTALAALSRFDEAGEEFLRATEAKEPGLKAAAFYNLGNAFMKKDKFKEAIEAYKRSLALNPKDERAKWNLEIALQKKKKDDEEKKKNEDKNKDQKDKDKDKDKKDDQKKDQGQQPPPDEKPPAEREIESTLDSLEKSPKELEKQRAMLRAVRRAPPTRDW